MTINKIGAALDNPGKDFIYDFLRAIEPIICIDVGAAAGKVALEILQCGAEKIYCFEPFVGNWEFFYKNTSKHPNLTLYRYAVSDEIGWQTFLQPAVVKGDEPGWETYRGYSSVGYLESVNQNAAAARFEVPVTTLDEEFLGRHISYLKIDVQGAEFAVLKGAKSLLRCNAIDLIYLEWTGDKEVVHFLNSNGYVVYDSLYTMVPTTYDKEVFKRFGFEFHSSANLSTGVIAYNMWLTIGEPVEIMKRLKTEGLVEWIQTDLVAISTNVIRKIFKE